MHLVNPSLYVYVLCVISVTQMCTNIIRYVFVTLYLCVLQKCYHYIKDNEGRIALGHAKS